MIYCGGIVEPVVPEHLLCLKLFLRRERSSMHAYHSALPLPFLNNVAQLPLKTKLSSAFFFVDHQRINYSRLLYRNFSEFFLVFFFCFRIFFLKVRFLRLLLLFLAFFFQNFPCERCYFARKN